MLSRFSSFSHGFAIILISTLVRCFHDAAAAAIAVCQYFVPCIPFHSSSCCRLFSFLFSFSWLSFLSLFIPRRFSIFHLLSSSRAEVDVFFFRISSFFLRCRLLQYLILAFRFLTLAASVFVCVCECARCRSTPCQHLMLCCAYDN